MKSNKKQYKFIYQNQIEFTQKLCFFEMNFANYSPYNKSYRFICFQNQAYHQKNKKNANPCINSNIRYMNRSFQNPQGFSERRSQTSHRFSRSNHSDMMSSGHGSSSMLRSSSLSGAMIGEGKRVVHKNQSFEKFRSRKVSHENIEMVNRLLKAQCQVIKNDQTQKAYMSHLKYRDIRKKYNEQRGIRTKMCLGNSELLCPTLLQYNRSGLAEKFVEVDLSMSMTPSTPSSRMRKRRSEGEYSQRERQQIL